MAKFIKLTIEADHSIFVNPEHVAYFRRICPGGEATLVQFSDTGEYERVRETPEQILALIDQRGEAA